MGIEPTLSCSAGSRLTIWLQRQLSKCPRWESNPASTFAESRARSTTLQGQVVQHPAEESNPVRQIRSLPCRPSHSQGVCFSSPSRNRTWSDRASEADMLSGTLTGHVAVRRRNLEAKQYQDLWRVGHRPGTMCSMVGGGRLSVTPSRHKSRRLDSHQHQPVNKTGAFLSRATSASSRSARSRTLLSGFGGRLLPRSTLLYSTFFRVTDGS